MKTSVCLLNVVATVSLICAAAPLHAQRDRHPVVKGSQTQNGQAAGPVCALLAPDDVAPVIGATKPAFSTAGHCTWESQAGGKMVVLVAARSKGPPAISTYDNLRKNGPRGSDKVADESGLGDNAFSALMEKGVEFDVLKDQKLLTVQYMTGAHGTAADLDKLRPVAKKAVAAY